MNNAKFYLFLGVLAFLQIAFFSHFENNASIPNLFVLMLIWMSLNRLTIEMYKVAVIGGFFLDVYSTGSFGINVISLALFAMILQLITSRIFPKDAAFRLLATFYFSGLLLYELVYFLVVFLSSYIDSSAFVSFADIFRLSLILQILYSLVLLYPIIYMSKRVLLNFDEK